MAQETNEKVLAMYRAVWELTREGQNVYNMKVVDITNRAGIGKGTAYEYFRSKEELISKALRYKSNMEYEQLRLRMEEQKTLEAVLRVGMQWLEEDHERIGCLLQFLKASEKPGDLIRHGVECLQENFEHDKEKIVLMLKFIVNLGKQEGVINPDIADNLAGLQILAQMMGYFVYERFSGKEISPEITKDFLITSLLKGLH